MQTVRILILLTFATSDHILTLQQSLGHIERMLNQSHSAYMSQLRSALELTKSGIDVKVLYLTSISLSVLCIQTLTSMLNFRCDLNFYSEHTLLRHIFHEYQGST